MQTISVSINLPARSYVLYAHLIIINDRQGLHSVLKLYCIQYPQRTRVNNSIKIYIITHNII